MVEPPIITTPIARIREEATEAEERAAAEAAKSPHPVTLKPKKFFCPGYFHERDAFRTFKMVSVGEPIKPSSTQEDREMMLQRLHSLRTFTRVQFNTAVFMDYDDLDWLYVVIGIFLAYGWSWYSHPTQVQFEPHECREVCYEKEMEKFIDLVWDSTKNSFQFGAFLSNVWVFSSQAWPGSTPQETKIKECLANWATEFKTEDEHHLRTCLRVKARNEAMLEMQKGDNGPRDQDSEETTPEKTEEQPGNKRPRKEPEIRPLKNKPKEEPESRPLKDNPEEEQWEWVEFRKGAFRRDRVTPEKKEEQHGNKLPRKEPEIRPLKDKPKEEPESRQLKGKYEEDQWEWSFGRGVWRRDRIIDTKRTTQSEEDP